MSIEFLTAAWCVPQIVCPVALLFRSQYLRSRFHTGATNQDPPGRKPSNYFALTGLAASGTVVALYAFRELWSSGQDVSVAADSFTVVRYTEVAYQLAYMAGATLSAQTRSIAERMFRSRARQVAAVLTCVALCGLSTVPVAVWTSWSLERFLAAEALVAIIRIITVVSALALLARPTTLPYVLASSLSVAVGVSASWIPWVLTSAYGLQLYQALVALPIIVVAAIVLGPRTAPMRRTHRSHTSDL